MSLVEGLAQAILALRDWDADKKHQQGYGYISADAVLTRCGRALGDAGVIVFPSVTEQRVFTIENATNRGGSRYDAVVDFDMMLIGEGGETLTAKWTGHGSDFTAPDKAVYKAITSGHKYFLMKLLLIGVGNEDGEHDEAAPSKAKNIPSPRPAPPAPPRQPSKQSGEWYDNAPADKRAFVGMIQDNLPRYATNAKAAGNAVKKLLEATGADFDQLTAAERSALAQRVAAYATMRDNGADADVALSAVTAKTNNAPPLLDSVEFGLPAYE
ncbi:MAG: ERF family protein [Anaerolineales bacterium]|nr:ERF family protein [Anaerolineales bacterium]